MTWDQKPFEIEPFVGPDVTAYVEENGNATYTKEHSAFVECDEPDCGETWDVVGPHDLAAKDAYLRTQGWSAAPRPDGTIEHKCLRHA